MALSEQQLDMLTAQSLKLHKLGETIHKQTSLCDPSSRCEQDTCPKCAALSRINAEIENTHCLALIDFLSDVAVDYGLFKKLCAEEDRTFQTRVMNTFNLNRTKVAHAKGAFVCHALSLGATHDQLADRLFTSRNEIKEIERRYKKRDAWKKARAAL